MTREEIIRNIREKKVIAIVRGFHPKQCIQLAEALYAGGINMIEVTFDQSGPDTWGETVEAIQAIWENFGGRVLPGAMTPTEAAGAHRAGADMIKLFPIANLGAAYLKALKAPLKHIDFMAVGGVSPDNIREFIKAGAVGAGVGGMLTRRELVEAGEFTKITALARRYMENANGVI